MSMRDFKRLLQLVLPGILLVDASRLLFAAEVNPPTVSMVGGRVFFMPREETLWLPLKKGVQIPIGSLVQVTENSVLKYSYKDSSGSLAVAAISTPSVFRLTGDEIRPTTTQNLVIDKDKLDDVKRLQSRTTVAPTYNIPIPYAWRRFTFLLAPEIAQFLATTVNFGKEKSKSAEIGGFRADYGLRLLHPRDRATVDSKLWPGLVFVEWKDLNKNDQSNGSLSNGQGRNRFHIYLWRDGTDRPAVPIAITSQESHRIMVADPGRWKIQVDKVTEDFKTISSSQQTIVNIVSNNPSAGLDAQLNKYANNAAGMIKARHPLDGFIHVVDKLPLRVDFVWDVKEGLAPDETYVFEIISNRQSKPQRYQTDRLTMSLDLKRQETYKWRLSILKAGEKNPGEWSNWYTFTIKQRADDPLRELLSRSEGGSLYLENGFMPN